MMKNDKLSSESECGVVFLKKNKIITIIIISHILLPFFIFYIEVAKLLSNYLYVVDFLKAPSTLVSKYSSIFVSAQNESVMLIGLTSLANCDPQSKLAFTGGRSKVVVKSVEGSRFRLRQEGENILF